MKVKRGSNSLKYILIKTKQKIGVAKATSCSNPLLYIRCYKGGGGRIFIFYEVRVGGVANNWISQKVI